MPPRWMGSPLYVEFTRFGKASWKNFHQGCIGEAFFYPPSIRSPQYGTLTL
jgi:hypothetical protein